MNQIKYREGYKYQLADSYRIKVDLTPFPLPVNLPFIRFTHAGELVIKKGYAWDGASGPTFDTLNTMRGSLVHDALYQLMREGCLDPDVYKDQADRLLQKILCEDGMSSIRAWMWYQGVKIGGKEAATNKDQNPILVAP